MKSRFKPTNFVAILIAILLIATGFALSFINRQMESDTQTTPAQNENTPELIADVGLTADDTFSQIALVHAEHRINGSITRGTGASWAKHAGTGGLCLPDPVCLVPLPFPTVDKQRQIFNIVDH